MKVYVFGDTGMLGSAVIREFKRASWSTVDEVVPVSHQDVDIAIPSFTLPLTQDDIVINCAGLRPQQSVEAIDMLLTNAVGPYNLLRLCDRVGARLIHISTDCVFSTKRWDHKPTMHSVQEVPSPDSHYGRTKLAGEITGPNAWTIRTSFVGPQHGLWKWIADQPKDAVIEGWYKAFWSGSTVWEVAMHVVSIALNPPTEHLIHLATQEPITKSAAVLMITKRLGRSDIAVVAGGPRVDRSLEPTICMAPLNEALMQWNG